MTTPQPLFRHLVGDAFDRLPAAVRRFHSPRGTLHTAGRAEVTGGNTFGARLLRIVAGLPRPGRDVEVEVSFTPVDRGEVWRRLFAGRFVFDIQVAFPLIGHVVDYSGWLEVTDHGIGYRDNPSGERRDQEQ